MKKAAGEADPRFIPVVDAFTEDTEVTSGTMMSAFGLKVNGKIFAMVARGRLVAKLPRTRVDEMVDAGQGERFDPGHGRRMKEWISVTAEDVDWVALAREAHHFVKTASR